MTELYNTNPGEPRATADGALRVAVVSGGGGGGGTSDTTEATQLLARAAVRVKTRAYTSGNLTSETKWVVQ